MREREEWRKGWEGGRGRKMSRRGSWGGRERGVREDRKKIGREVTRKGG